MLILGIDDAGRGPIIGPMILAGCLVSEVEEEEFKSQGVKDSKLLSSLKREILAEIVKKKSLNYQTITISPREIDSSLNSGINLNRLEAMKMAEIINKINTGSKGIDKIRVIVDCPSNNIPAWQAILESYIAFKENLEIVCEHKADLNHISVSAASIIAKSTREKEVLKLKKTLGLDFGSGYPSDPETKKFLEKYGKKFQDACIFRKTWATWSNHVGKKQQTSLGEY